MKKVLARPADIMHTYATDFGSGCSASHVSYFAGVDVTNDDLVSNGILLKSGVSGLSTYVVCSWSGARHTLSGNFATNRFAIS